MITYVVNAIETFYIEAFRLGIGLIILMCVNITLGTINSLFESEFNTSKFFKGIGKAIVLIICFCAVYFAGILNKDTLSISMGADVSPIDIVDALHALLIAGYFVYSKEVLGKMRKIVGVDENQSKVSVKPIPLEHPESHECAEDIPDNPHEIPVLPEQAEWYEYADEEEGECYNSVVNTGRVNNFL